MGRLASGLMVTKNNRPFGNAKAKPAAYDASAQSRRVLIAKVKIAVKDLDMADDDYRHLLFKTTGQMSAADCTEQQLQAMIVQLKQRGFTPKLARGRSANHPGAGKARALWISLYHLGAIHNGSEQALEAFAARQLKCERLQWADQGQVYKLIEALKAIAERNGWSQSTTDMTPTQALREIKRQLVLAIMAKLVAADLVPADWTMDLAAFRLGGIQYETSPLFWTPEQFDHVAKMLGKVLRDGGARG